MERTRRYGLYTGLIFTAALFLLSLRKIEAPESTLNYSFLSCFPFLIFFILMAMLNRRKELGNHIDFTEAFKAGLGVSAIAGIIYAAGNYIYLKWVNHGLIEAIVVEYRKQLITQHKTVDEINTIIAKYVDKLPFSTATYRLVTIIFIGGILSILFALIVRRKHIEVLTETE